MNLDAFPREPLLFGPSPVHPLDRLTSHLGGARMWAKRDDCNSGLAYGGNKTRKLEYLVADALAKGCDTLVSIGGVQSNHTRQVAAVAARTGLGCVLVQESWVDWPDVVYDRVGNIQLSRIMGADVRLVEAGFGIGFKESWEQALADVEAAGGTPYAIPAGASDHELGGLGFARWAQELAEQERELGVFFGRDLREDEILLDDRYHAGTYGIPDEQTLDAIRTAGRLEGMITDPVYEGKSMAGMIDLVGSGEIEKGSNVLYAHLGGQPALSAYAALFR
jgi:1-aminocyclopropane-1-carboxylate deaminase